MSATSARTARPHALRCMAATAAAVAAFAGAGCGSSDAGGSPSEAQKPASTAEPTPEAPTKAAYVKELDALCASREGGAKRYTAPIGKAGADLNAALASGANTDAIMDRIGRLHGRLADRRKEGLGLMQAVDPPQDGGATAFFARFARTTVLVRKLAATAPKMDGSWEGWLNGFNKQATTISRAAATSRKAARAYGIKRCETRPAQTE